MRVIRRVYNTFAFQSCDIEVPAVGTGSTSNNIITLTVPAQRQLLGASVPAFCVINSSGVLLIARANSF